MEANTEAIVRLTWARVLGLGDDTLLTDGAPVITRPDDETIMVVALFDRVVITGPPWLLARAATDDVTTWADETVLLRVCDGHHVRLVGQARLAVTDEYARLDGLTEVPVAIENPVVADLERRCPPDDVAEVGLASMQQTFVTLDDADQPTAGAGYDEWHGFLAHLGVLTPPELRGAGHGTRAAAVAMNDALDVGLVPQWRSRVGNHASAAVADRLGFTPIGSQTTLRLLP